MQDFFSYYIRQQTILADVTVGCQSNSRRVSSISDLLAPAAKSGAGGTACSRLPWPVVPAQASAPPTTPTAGQGIPLITHTPCYSTATVASHRSRTGERSYSSPRGHPLPRLPRLRVVPFLCLTVVHRPGALGVAWSMWSTNNIHRKRTVRGEADGWVHGRTQGNASLLCTK